MEPANLHILTINGGSSSIKFALFEAAESLKRILAGGIERIGLPDATWHSKGVDQADNFSRSVTAPDHSTRWAFSWIGSRNVAIRWLP